MERRTICIQVRDYLMQRAGESAGASGSDRAAALRLTFDQSWAGLTKTVYFTDAREEASTSQVLGLGDLVAGETETYDVPIPANALKYEGRATVTVRGVALDTSGQTERAVTTAAILLKVLDSKLPETVGELGQVEATAAEQLQAEIDGLKALFLTSASQAKASQEAAAASETQAKASEAAAQESETQAAASAAAAAGSAAQAATIETEARTREAARQAAETARAQAETKRQQAETGREDAEARREQAEADRAAAEAARDLWEDYDPTHAYVPGNKTAYLGSSYLCIAPSTGNDPTDPAHWRKIAARGEDGKGTGNMHTDVYDPQGKAQDVFAYTDEKIAKIPTPDVSRQIAAHNSAEDAHAARFGPFLPMIGGGGSGELEDLQLQGGRLVNAGAGWQTQPFPRPFAGAPVVLLQPVAFPGWAEVKDVTAEGFSYRLVKPVYTPGSQGSVTTGSYYTANGTSSSNSHAEHTLVSGVTLPTLPKAENQETAEKVTVFWLAMETEGENDAG